MRRLRLGCETEATALKNVLHDFFSPESDGFHHKRIDFDIAEFRAQCEKNRSNGLKGGRPKGKKTQWVSSGLPVVTQTDATANPNHKPLTINHKPNNKDIRPSDVSITIWDEYVKHRKAKKATISNTVIESLRVDAQSVGLTIEQAIQMQLKRGWTGFDPSWVTAANQPSNAFVGAI
jgi:uncharacterized protein YdaU (DUF1376 family)